MASGRTLESIGRSGSPLAPKWRLVHLDHELVFSRLGARDILIVLYRRVSRSPGLRNPFLAMNWFVRFLADRRQELGLDAVTGTVSTSRYRADGGLDDSRLLRYYQKHHGARLVETSTMSCFSALEQRTWALLGTRWVRLDLADYLTPSEYRRSFSRPR